MCLGFGTILSGIGLLGTSGYLISAAALQPSIAELQIAIVAVRFFGISRGVFRYAERLVSHDATLRLLGGLRVWFYRRLEPLAPARIREYRRGDLLSRLVHDIDLLEDLYVRVISPALIALGVGLFTGFLLGRWDPLFAVAFWCFYLIAAFLIPFGVGRLTKSAADAQVARRGELEGFLLEYLGGLADLLLFDHSKSWQNRIQALSRHYEQSLARLTRITSVFEALLNLVQNLALIPLLLIAIPAVISGDLDPVFLAAALLISYAGYEAVLPLPRSSRQWSSSTKAARRLFEILDVDPAVLPPEKPIPAGEPSRLQAQELEFYYPNEHQSALSDVSFRIRKGEQIGIAGRSGAGKSTLVNLLLRFWEYTSGSMRLDTTEIRELLPGDVRRFFAVVEQDGYLFEGTIRQNLKLAKSDAPDDTILTALRDAEALQFIESLPEGLDTWIGEHGFGLSGGEARRILIARALLQDRSALVLDEPTADVDPLTANKLIRTLRSETDSRLIIWITHRLGGLDFLDEILVLEKGQVIERGGFSDLLDQKGVFYKQWGKQLEAKLMDQLPKQISDTNER
jgi:ATP-binding cassette subfamily C protein CydC